MKPRQEIKQELKQKPWVKVALLAFFQVHILIQPRAYLPTNDTSYSGFESVYQLITKKIPDIYVNDQDEGAVLQ